jgi:hypothetical protein
MPSIFVKEQKILQQPVDFLYLKIAGQKLFNFLGNSGMTGQLVTASIILSF